jgi:hypothetical protein
MQFGTNKVEFNRFRSVLQHGFCKPRFDAFILETSLLVYELAPCQIAIRGGINLLFDKSATHRIEATRVPLKINYAGLYLCSFTRVL